MSTQARLLNTCGMKCPKPLFEVHKAVNTMAAGDVVQVHSDDPAFRLDIEAWCRRTGHNLISVAGQSPIVAVIQKA